MLARQEGLIVDRIISECFQSSLCKFSAEKATREYINQNNTAYFRARVATRAILGGLTGAGLAGAHGAVDSAVENGLRDVNEFIPRVIYGTD